MPVDRQLAAPDLAVHALLQTGLNRQELELFLEADRWSKPTVLPAELFEEGRWLKDMELADPPDAWWRLSLPVIGPEGTLVLIELCTPSRTYPMQFFSPRIGALRRLD